jgi:beta-lactamase regulating signal transducer with metallopeptidase domain
VRLAASSVLLGLVWFAAINLVGTAIALASMRATSARRPSAGALLALRLLPAALSAFFVVAVFLPAHLLYEPAEADESFGIGLLLMATMGLMLIGRSILRAARVLRTDLRLAAITTRIAERTEIAIFEVTGLAGVSLAGILRPKILIGSAALAELTPAELDVAISHELAHRRSRDNFKRFLICCAPDVFGLLPAARRLEDRWDAETECQADADAVAGDDRRAVMLASALVKVARLTRPAAISPSPAWSGFHVAALLETRVKRLVGGETSVRRPGAALWPSIAIAAVAVPAAAWMLDLSYAVHQVTEALVTSLP